MQGRSLEFRVGVFVTLALITGIALVFSLGNRSALFSSKSTYRAVFENVEGLRPGSPIRMSGIDVGTVSYVGFMDDGRCEVRLEVESAQARFITSAATVAIGSKGLLGDKLVEITPGAGEPLPDGAEIPSSAGGGLAGAMAAAGEVMNDVRPAIANVRRLTDVFAEDQFRQDIRDISHNIADITRMVREEDGTVHRLLTDPGMADRITNTLASVEATSRELAATTRNVRAITDEVRGGDGTAHELIYGARGTALLASLSSTAEETATMLRDVRTGDGTVHQLIYGHDADRAITNINAMTDDLAAIAHDVRSGRGTLGALLVDPSIYEDVRRIVGNVERNDILRALVRYSIREDEAEPSPLRVERRDGE